MRTISDKFTERFLRLFWAKVDVRGDAECWEWTGFKASNGYGKFGKPRTLTHRISWVIHNGTIPTGLLVCHSCDNRCCVNPNHLWLGTHLDNNQDRVKKGRTRSADVRGEKNPRAKLKEQDIREIRILFAGGNSAKEIASIYGVSRSMIQFIVLKKNWSHIE